MQFEAHKNGPATLLFNKSRSIYINNSAPKRDSSFSTDVVEFSFSGLVISNMIAGDIQFPEGKDMGITQAAYQKDLEAFRASLIKDQKAQGYAVTITFPEAIELNMNN